MRVCMNTSSVHRSLKEVSREELSNFEQLGEFFGDLRGVEARVACEGEAVFLDLDGESSVLEKKVHHLGVADVVGEFLVFRADGIGTRELDGLEVNILEAEHLAEAGENVLWINAQLGEVAREKENEITEEVVVGLTMSFGVGGISFVVVVKDDNVMTMVLAFELVACVAIGTFAERIEERVAQGERGVFAGGEFEGELCGDTFEAFAASFLPEVAPVEHQAEEGKNRHGEEVVAHVIHSFVASKVIWENRSPAALYYRSLGASFMETLGKRAHGDCR